MQLPQLRSVVPFAIVAGLAVGVIGCGGDGIQISTAPKADIGKPDIGKGGPEPAAGEYRILGAMFPADAPEWFFKMPGTSEDLAKYDADFDKLLASVSLAPNGPKYDAPAGWKEGPGRPGGIVIATIKTPDGKYEVSVSSAQGDVFGNVRRWSVEQLGNTVFGREEMAKATRTVEAKGVKGLRVDVRGPKKPPMGGGGPMMGPK